MTEIVDIINGITLQVPLTFYTNVDSDKSYFAICLEIPRLYGCGYTKQNAVEMLKREIYSMYEDLSNSENITDELLNLKMLLKTVFGNNDCGQTSSGKI